MIPSALVMMPRVDPENWRASHDGPASRSNKKPATTPITRTRRNVTTGSVARMDQILRMDWNQSIVRRQPGRKSNGNYVRLPCEAPAPCERSNCPIGRCHSRPTKIDCYDGCAVRAAPRLRRCTGGRLRSLRDLSPEQSRDAARIPQSMLQLS